MRVKKEALYFWASGVRRRVVLSLAPKGRACLDVGFAELIPLKRDSVLLLVQRTLLLFCLDTKK
jgi:hypothetical protein